MNKSEYDYIDVIGETSETYKNKTEKYLNQYAHRQEARTVKKLLGNIARDFVVDLGCSIGSWYDDYKRLGFKHITGIDISEERANKAKQRGYNEVYVCNASSLPFPDNSVSCIISNDVMVHIINDSDKLKVFKEIKRVLAKDGVFIFNIANAKWFGYETDTTKEYCRFNIPETVFCLLESAKLTPKSIWPSYFMKPLIFARPECARISSKIVFPLIDSIYTKLNKYDYSKVLYFKVQ